MSETTVKRGAKLRELALAYSERKDMEPHVVEVLSSYMETAPDDGYAWFLYGDALRVVGRHQESSDALMKALDFAPKSSRFAIYARIGMLMRKYQGPPEAEKWYRLATAEPGCPGWMWCARGENLFATGAFRLAKDCLQASMKAGEVDREEVLLNLALIARAEREYAKARDYAREALSISTNYPEAQRVLDSLVGIEVTVQQAS